METDHDLGKQRGLSETTLALFNLRHNGNGWEYDTRTMDGGQATRWKHYDSAGSPKYRWIPDKPASAK